MEALLPIEEVLLELEFERGIGQGIERGEFQLARKILIKMIQRKFGELSAEALMKVHNADFDTLNSWIERVIDVHDLQEIWS